MFGHQGFYIISNNYLNIIDEISKYYLHYSLTNINPERKVSNTRLRYRQHGNKLRINRKQLQINLGALTLNKGPITSFVSKPHNFLQLFHYSTNKKK